MTYIHFYDTSQVRSASSQTLLDGWAIFEFKLQRPVRNNICVHHHSSINWRITIYMCRRTADSASWCRRNQVGARGLWLPWPILIHRTIRNGIIPPIWRRRIQCGWIDIWRCSRICISSSWVPCTSSYGVNGTRVWTECGRFRSWHVGQCRRIALNFTQHQMSTLTLRFEFAITHDYSGVWVSWCDSGWQRHAVNSTVQNV